MSALALTILKYTLGTALTTSLLALGGLWFFQRKLIYPSNIPEGSRTDVPAPSHLGLPYEDIRLTTPDNVSLHAYLIPARRTFVPTAELQQLAPEERKRAYEREAAQWVEDVGDEKGDAVGYARGRPTVLIFHANAGNMGHRIPLARKFNTDFGCNVFMLSYRGYGKSEGHASEIGMRIDVDTAIQYIKAHPLVGDTKLVVYGQSIGGAVCLYAASQFPDLISGIILENTFVSLQSLIPSLMPHIPRILLPILLSEHWDAESRMALVPRDTPVLMLSGLRDELVRPEHMARLRDLRRGRGQVQAQAQAQKAQKGEKGGKGEKGDGEEREEIEGKVKFIEFPLGGHNDTCLIPDYWKEIGIWLKDEIDT